MVSVIFATAWRSTGVLLNRSYVPI
jgi:hypothetical protein